MVGISGFKTLIKIIIYYLKAVLTSKKSEKAEKKKKCGKWCWNFRKMEYLI